MPSCYYFNFFSPKNKINHKDDFSKIEVRARFIDKKKVANVDNFKLTLNAFTDEKYKEIMHAKGCDKKVSQAEK